MKPNDNKPFMKKEYKILLVDDHMGNFTSANFLQYKLNECLCSGDIKDLYGDIDIALKISPEQHLRRLEYRLKSEPIDLVLLDLDFKYDHDYSSDYDSFTSEVEKNYNLPTETIKKELGAYWLQQKIRPFNPSIPVIMFTSKFLNAMEMASKYGLYGFHADYFEKAKLLWDYGSENEKRLQKAFSLLIHKILDGIRRYESDYIDKIEVKDSREESPLAAKNRDYMQTRLWSVLTEHISRNRGKNIDSWDGKFGLLFLDFDGMKAVNDRLGQVNTNVVIKNFTEKVSKYLEEHGGDSMRAAISLTILCWEDFSEKGEMSFLYYSPQ